MQLLTICTGAFVAYVGIKASFDQCFRDDLKRTFGYFDSNGLKYSVPYLESIFPDIVFYDVKYQAKFADVVTTYNLAFAEEQLKAEYQTIDETVLPTLNATSIGNLAFIYLNTKDQQVKDICSKLLGRLKAYYQI